MPFLCLPADTAFWDPTNDPFLPACYSPNQQEGKALCKRFLQMVRSMVPCLAWSLGFHMARPCAGRLSSGHRVGLADSWQLA